MLFNTVQYVIFLPMVVLFYYLLPQKMRYIWLLIVSYYFYMQWNPLYILLLFFCTLITYIGGLILQKLKEENISVYNTRREKYFNKQKICLLVCILTNLSILGFYKYFMFGINCLNKILHFFHSNQISIHMDFLLPVGISFYTLQALGYLIDVYRGDVYAEKNFLRYALFVSFFPQLVAGPIERSKNLLTQLYQHHYLNFEYLKKGMLLVIYGLFLKMVIADRAAVIVNTVYGDIENYPGFYIIVATLFFSIQIYCDFCGYSTIARGSALILGIRLMDNFAAPYYSRSIKEFWRRWHISLSSWFRDYLYIPLGGNRGGLIRKERNLLVIFAVSGLWHGASLSFMFWGLLHGMYQCFSDIAQEVRKLWAKVCSKCNLENGTNQKSVFSKRLFQRLYTFALVSFAWLFFRAGGIKNAFQVLKSSLHIDNWTVIWDGSLYKLGVPRNYMVILILSIIVLLIVDYYKYRGKDVAEIVLRQGWIFQMLLILALVFTILLYGCYGKMYDIQQFIYFQF